MRWFSVFLLTVPSIYAAAQPSPYQPRFTDPDRKAKLMSAAPTIEKLFETYAKSRRIPGLVYGLVIDGEPVLIKATGVRDRKSNDPVTPNTVFRIASMTKSFTALAILRLRDEGKLSLEDPVAKYIPEFARMKMPTTDTAPIRIRELMTHGAGFPEDNPWGDRQLAISPDVLTRWLKEGIPFSTPPNTAYEYSNYGFGLLGRIVAKASRTSYKDYVTKQILKPLGMTASTLEMSEVSADVRATGYRFDNSDQLQEEVPLAHGEFGSMGGMWVSAQDLAKYVAFQLSAFPPRDDADVAPVARASMREQQSAARSSAFRVTRNGESIRAVDIAYGFGLGVSRDCRFDHIVGHGGGLPGFGSYMQWLPEYGVGMFAMANLTYAGPSQPIDQSWDALLETGGLKPRTVPPSPEVTAARDAIFKLWSEWSDSAANAIAADNLFLDRPANVRKNDIAAIKKEVGACQSPTDVEPENWLRGAFSMPCERGRVRVTFTLAPTQPPRVQYLAFVPASNLQPAMEAAAQAVAGLFGSEPGDGLAQVAGPGLNTADLHKRVSDLKARYGWCRVGDPVVGNGKTFTRLRLECEKGAPEAVLRAAEDGTLSSVEFQPPAGSACSQ
jgi:CubicO group peptidase (beta-lactamase class C family)